MILSREEFAHHFNALRDGLGDSKSPLWIPDQVDAGGPSQWFVCVEPLGVNGYKFEYYNWCTTTLKGRVRCYSSDSDDKKEWWGFTDKQDIVLWTLKWT